MRDLIVIGAGLAGSSLAAAMARRGWDVLLVERRQPPRHKVCGEFLSPESLQSLHALGLYPAVARLDPCPMDSVRLVGRRGASLHLPLPGEAWGLSRYALDTALLSAARLAGAEVKLGACASHILPEPRSHRVAVDGAWLRSRAVVAAWGRQTLPALRTHRPPPPVRSWVGVKRHYTGASPSRSVELYFVEGGYVGLAPVEGGRLNCSALVSQPAFLAAGGGLEPFLAAACQQNPALAARLAGARPVAESEATISGVETGRPPLPWNGGGWPHLGDAAAMIPPLVGDGMAMALRSAELTLPLLESYLLGELSREAWGERYRRAYQAEFARRIGLARQVQSWLVRPGLCDGLLLLGRLLPGVASRLVRLTRGPVGSAPPINS
ncbi:MAG: NAD(P)/FAD-dependent oxidoreductase [Bacillota bacterium]